MFEVSNYGGNRVTKIAIGNDLIPLADDSYHYGVLHLNAGQRVSLDRFSSRVVYFYSGQQVSASVESEGTELNVTTTGALFCDNKRVEILSNSNDLTLFVAGMPDGQVETDTLLFVSDASIKKVSKPWGYEMWVNGEHPQYCLKRIYIKAGNKTSLQYHEYKRETNLVFKGETKLHYYQSHENDLQKINFEDVKEVTLKSVTAIDVWPNHLHRIEAITDTLLFEVSTPYLDDVIRVEDDSGRKDGRISSEHLS